MRIPSLRSFAHHLFQASTRHTGLPAFVFLWALTEFIRHGTPEESGKPEYGDNTLEAATAPAGQLAATELLKLALALCWHFISGRRKCLTQDEEISYIPVSADSSQSASPSRWMFGTQTQRRAAWTWFTVAGLYACHQYTAALFRSGSNGAYIHDALLVPGTALCVLSLSRWVLQRPASVVEWQSVVLQLCGILLLASTLPGVSKCVPWSTSLAGLALLMACALTLNDHSYSSSATPFTTTIIPLLAWGSAIHCAVALFRAIALAQMKFEPRLLLSSRPFTPGTSMLFEILTGLASLSIIYHRDALVLSVLCTIGSSLALVLRAAPWPVLTSMGFMGGAAVFAFGASTFLSSHTPHQQDDQPELSKIARRKSGIILVLGLISTCIAALGATSRHSCGMPTGFLQPHKVVAQATIAHVSSNCTRKPLPFTPKASGPRTYHSFDDVLLIVFFSHARYGANLDYYKEVYADFFPNMVFIGPASREDAGFAHSYDILVDSYESDEDLSDPSFYKMAGRMAHHMLYTAMMEHPCYDGYLWAPFDTLLNLPRLQAFDQSQFWYHSPWGRYVPNPAMAPDSSTNKSASGNEKHAPPANVSPDPTRNLVQDWRGWGKDWWWGDPHVGLSVCMPAFERVPLDLRQRLARFTSGQTRFIGGSSDTVYIPGKHRSLFMDVLGLFLETDCFLEIAVPTTLHLVVPDSEEILFVDHWWIWQPPFDAQFVRAKWAEGFEVDTFHTFHWGEKTLDGVWHGNHAHVEDVRNLLRESAGRQGINWEW